MGAWVLLRHDLPDGSWHHDWMLEDHRAPEGPLSTFRLGPEVEWPPCGTFSALQLPPHRRAYLEYEGPVSGGRGTVRRVAAGTCETAVGPDRMVVDTSGLRLVGHVAGPAGPERPWRFEVAPADLELADGSGILGA